jgi:hypothetical protein
LKINTSTRVPVHFITMPKQTVVFYEHKLNLPFAICETSNFFNPIDPIPAPPASRAEFPRPAQSARGLAHSKTLRVRRLQCGAWLSRPCGRRFLACGQRFRPGKHPFLPRKRRGPPCGRRGLMCGHRGLGRERRKKPSEHCGLQIARRPQVSLSRQKVIFPRPRV